MKRFIGIGLGILMVMMTLLGCAKKDDTAASAGKEGKKISIVTTIFPAYDWVKQVVGDNKNVEISFLIDKGVDLHSYQASAQDIAKITDSDLFVYVGGESDGWAEDIVKENPNLKYISMVDSIGKAALEEELVEGMQEEQGEEEGEECAIDEHVWLSLANAKTIVGAIEAKLAEIDPDNKSSYEKNANDYIAKLDALDKEYQDALSKVQDKTILVGDRFPFRYLVNEYGIKYYAAFKGCDANSEVSFETVKFLANKMDELKLTKIFIIDGSKGDLAKTIVENTKDKNAKVLVLDSMQSTKSSDNADYLDIMKKNLEVLKEAL